MQTKTCTKCGVSYLATTEFFYAHKWGKYGLNSWCKICHGQRNRENGARVRREHPERRKEYYLQNRERILQRGHEYYHANREQYATWRREWNWRNPELVKAKRLRYKERHKDNEEKRERRRVLSRARYHNSPEVQRKSRLYSRNYEARKKNAEGRFTPADIDMLFRSQKGRCWYCQCKLPKPFDIDHRVPLSKGGTNWPNNLVLTCVRCNRSKHDKLPHEWSDRLL